MEIKSIKDACDKWQFTDANYVSISDNFTVSKLNIAALCNFFMPLLIYVLLKINFHPLTSWAVRASANYLEILYRWRTIDDRRRHSLRLVFSIFPTLRMMNIIGNHWLLWWSKSIIEMNDNDVSPGRWLFPFWRIKLLTCRIRHQCFRKNIFGVLSALTSNLANDH